MISVSVRPARAVPLAASCALHLALAGVVAGLLPHWVSPAPVVLEAQLIEPDRPLPAREPERMTPRPSAPRPTVLPRLVEPPKPIAPPPVATPAPPPPETAPPAPAEPAPLPAPALLLSRERFAIAATEPATASAELSVPAPIAPPPAVAKAPSDTGITRTATPSGGYQVRPSYPSTARRLGIEGTSLLRVFVAADGRVTEVEVDQSAGHPDLDRAAAEAVRRWKFEPGRRGSEPIGMWVRLPVQFVLK